MLMLNYVFTYAKRRRDTKKIQSCWANWRSKSAHYLFKFYLVDNCEIKNKQKNKSVKEIQILFFVYKYHSRKVECSLSGLNVSIYIHEIFSALFQTLRWANVPAPYKACCYRSQVSIICCFFHFDRKRFLKYSLALTQSQRVLNTVARFSIKCCYFFLSHFFMLIACARQTPLPRKKPAVTENGRSHLPTDVIRIEDDDDDDDVTLTKNLIADFRSDPSPRNYFGLHKHLRTFSQRDCVKAE